VRRGWSEPEPLRTNLFGYVDARDVAGAVVAALESGFEGAEVMSIFAADTTWNRPNADLVERFFPGATLSPELGPYETLVSIDKARRLIGWSPKHSWRDVLKG
jgi:nucleoside-diphosphate-sugar epimerase